MVYCAEEYRDYLDQAMVLPSGWPTEKQLVQALMPLLRVEEKDVDRKNGRREGVLHNIYQCPKLELYELKGQYSSQKSSGYTNPFRHLLRC